MKLYILLAIITYVLADDPPGIQCPNGNICPVGKTCCETSGHFECCDIPESDRQNKKLVPGVFHSQTRNETVAQLDPSCPTRCSFNRCCPFYGGTCCTGNTCCPSGARCCGYSSNEWCCKITQRCAATTGYCYGGSAALTPAFLSMLAVLFVAVSLKHF